MSHPPFPAIDPGSIEEYTRSGYWMRESLAEVVHRHAQQRPTAAAIVHGGQPHDGGRPGPDAAGRSLTWAAYDAESDSMAAALVAAGLTAGDRLGVLLPDGPDVHVAFLAAEKAGLPVIGIGPRAGEREIRHLLQRVGAEALLTEATHRGRDATELVQGLRRNGLQLQHLTLPLAPLSDPSPTAWERLGLPSSEAKGEGSFPRTGYALDRRLGPNDVFMLNSTSGTTGLPKQVLQFQNRWVAFHHLAVRAGRLTGDDVFLSLPPAPYGFGLWTAHITPALLGATTVLMTRFSAEAALDVIERHKVTVLACVSTQFIMLLNSPTIRDRDLSSLRVMFTGGEPVPYERAAEFEERTGAAVLQFFGSNETGALSYTTLDDSRDQRLRTCGKVIPHMNVRLLDDEGRDVPAGEAGQPACKGPLASTGYYDDEVANAELFTPDGWLRTGDIAAIDSDGYLRLMGRKSDFIIRGGKNIGAPAVEDEVATHPAVAMVAVVGMPDAVFGERVCAYVVPRSGQGLTLDELAAHLDGRGVSKEMFPERLIVVDTLPSASGGKVAKAELRTDIRRRLEEEAHV